jgi:hypothetical protein
MEVRDMSVISERTRQVELPASARARTTLGRLDYTDAFVLAGGAARERTGEDWARAVLEDAPPALRQSLRRGWCALGLRLGSTRDERRVLGWAVRRRTPEHVLLGADSPLGLRGDVLFATLVQLGNPLARQVWARVIPTHQRVVATLIDGAAERAAAAP